MGKQIITTKFIITNNKNRNYQEKTNEIKTQVASVVNHSTSCPLHKLACMPWLMTINASTISTPWDRTGWPVAKGWMRVP